MVLKDRAAKGRILMEDQEYPNGVKSFYCITFCFDCTSWIFVISDVACTNFIKHTFFVFSKGPIGDNFRW